ncbi:hypothetical protein [Bacillus horti]|uniref:Uncharacterized protein n=1 Tax=Caldalkalibacillus horti TaxID=77523 RepID=A0ABT9VUD0_9BACI|nr:hypothetical protein [Bacillus horti]MDQ0164583.1 hypothetical protein [Bacillus horti]
MKKLALTLALVGVFAFTTGCADVEPGPDNDMDMETPGTDMNEGGDGIGG